LYQQVGAGVVATIALVVFLFVGAPAAHSHWSSAQMVLDAVAGSVGLGVGMWSLLSSQSVEGIVTDWIEPTARLLGRGIWVWLQGQYTMVQSVVDGLFHYYRILWHSIWSLLLQQQLLQLPFLSGCVGLETLLGTIVAGAGGTSPTATTGREIAQGSTSRDATTAAAAAAAFPALDSALRVPLHSSMIDYQSNLEMHRSMTNYRYYNYSNTNHSIVNNNNSYSYIHTNNDVNINNQSRDDAHSIYTTSLSSVASGSLATTQRTPRSTGLRQPQIILSPEEMYSPALAKPFTITSITTTTKSKTKKKHDDTNRRSHHPKYDSTGPGALFRLD
jgi:hypothetical protein